MFKKSFFPRQPIRKPGLIDCRQTMPSAAAAGSPYLQQLYAAAASPYMHPNILGLASMGSGQSAHIVRRNEERKTKQ